MRSLLVLFALSVLILSACSPRPEYYREPKDGNIYWNPGRPLKMVFPPQTVTNGIRAELAAPGGKRELTLTGITATNSNLVLSFSLSGDTPPDGSYAVRISGDGGRVLTNNVLVIDTVAPVCRVVSHSREIRKGGSALVLIEASDANLKHPAVLVKNEGRFFSLPGRRRDLYACVICWPVSLDRFEAVVIAQDRAGNAVTNPVPIETKHVKYIVSTIPIDHEFRNDKLEEVGENPSNRSLTEEERYKLILKGFQDKRDVNIVELTMKKIDEKTDVPYFRPFDPMPKARTTSPYGEHRYFVMKNKTVRDSFHLGIDLALVKNADILAADDGTVLYGGYNGANGNMLLVYHGSGVYTLYAHCSKLLVRPFERVARGQKIAVSGKTGYALGDHLHFSVIVQGRYVSPLEWMDPEWIAASMNGIQSNTDRK